MPPRWILKNYEDSDRYKIAVKIDYRRQRGKILKNVANSS
jgi:hypothetical protein